MPVPRIVLGIGFLLSLLGLADTELQFCPCSIGEKEKGRIFSKEYDNCLVKKQQQEISIPTEDRPQLRYPFVNLTSLSVQKNNQTGSEIRK